MLHIQQTACFLGRYELFIDECWGNIGRHVVEISWQGSVLIPQVHVFLPASAVGNADFLSSALLELGAEIATFRVHTQPQTADIGKNEWCLEQPLYQHRWLPH